MNEASPMTGAGRDLFFPHHKKLFYGDTWRILRREDVNNGLMYINLNTTPDLCEVDKTLLFLFNTQEKWKMLKKHLGG